MLDLLDNDYVYGGVKVEIIATSLENIEALHKGILISKLN